MFAPRMQRPATFTPPVQRESAPFASRPFALPASRDPQAAAQPQEEHSGFHQDRSEAFGLRLKAGNGTITLAEQERLNGLQARMDAFWADRRDRENARPQFLDVPRDAPEAIAPLPSPYAAPIQRRDAGVIQRKVFLFSGSRKKTPLTEGAEWFGQKPANLTPSDAAIYREGVSSTTHRNHAIVDGMNKEQADYGLKAGESAIVVAHGSLGGGDASFHSDPDEHGKAENVTPHVLDAVDKIIKANQHLDQTRIFVAACNSARNQKNLDGTTCDSPIQHIITKLKLHDQVKSGKVAFEGYTAQAGLADYSEEHVGPDKKGMHIWGKNKVTSANNIKDTDGAGEKIFGYDTSVTARAEIGANNEVNYSQQSKPLGDFNTPLDKIKDNQALLGTMASTAPLAASSSMPRRWGWASVDRTAPVASTSSSTSSTSASKPTYAEWKKSLDSRITAAYGPDFRIETDLPYRQAFENGTSMNAFFDEHFADGEGWELGGRGS